MTLSEASWQRQHDETSNTVRRTMLALIGFSFFCALTLAAPDASLLSNQATIKVPFAKVEVAFTGFLIVGPVALIILSLYLPVFVGYLVSLGESPDHQETQALPYMFNIKSVLPSIASHLIFYWLPPIILFGFAWKALWRPEGLILMLTACIFTTGLVWLQLRRVGDIGIRRLGLWATLLVVPAAILFDRPVDLIDAELPAVDLADWNLAGADAASANFQAANLRGINLGSADLSFANLRGAKLARANLRSASLYHSNLRQADLGAANLQDAILDSADLRDANLQGVILLDAEMRKTDIRGVDLRGVRSLTQDQVSSACGDEQTRLPEGLSTSVCRVVP